MVLPADPERRGGRSFLFVLRVVLARKRQASVAPWSPWYDGTDLVKGMNGKTQTESPAKSRERGFQRLGVSHCGRSHSCFSGLGPFGRAGCWPLPVTSSVQTAAFLHLRAARAPQRPDRSSAGLPERLRVGLCLPCALSPVSRHVGWLQGPELSRHLRREFQLLSQPLENC